MCEKINESCPDSGGTAPKTNITITIPYCPCANCPCRTCPKNQECPRCKNCRGPVYPPIIPIIPPPTPYPNPFNPDRWIIWQKAH